MSITGVVRQGVVVPESPLPEGARVQITVFDPKVEMPPELQEELDAWERASSKALDLVERIADQDDGK